MFLQDCGICIVGVTNLLYLKDELVRTIPQNSYVTNDYSG
jgi:hypothetical protein